MENAIVENGYLIDPETGEILGLAGVAPEFRVESESEAEWVLGKMLDAAADLASVQHSPEVLRAKAVLEQAAKIEKEKRNRLEWLQRRFNPELGEFARKQLEGKKTKTWKSILGSISLRTVRGGLRVANPELALNWARSHAPEAIKVSEAFLITLLPEAHKTRLMESFATDRQTVLAEGAFEVKPDEEQVVVKFEVPV